MYTKMYSENNALHNACYALMTEQETSRIEHGYDAVGNRVARTIDGQITDYQYDDNDQLLEARTGDDAIVFTYDNNGNLREATGPETWRAFELTVVDGKSCEEVAKQIGRPVGTVYAARSRVMRRLRNQVQRLEESER